MKTFLKYFISLGLGIGLLWWVYKDQNLTQMLEGMKKANFLWIAACITTGLIAHWSRAERWKMLLKPMGYAPTTLNTFNAVMTGYVVNLVLPRAGEVSRCAFLYKSDDVPVEKGVGTVVAERIIDLLSLVAFTLVAVVIQFNTFGRYLINNFNKQPQEGSNTKWIIIGLVILSILFTVFLLKKFKNRLVENPLIAKIWNFAEGLVDGLVSVKKLNNPYLFLTHTLLIWCMYFMAVYCLFKAFDYTHELGFGIALAIFVIGSMGMVIPTPGGIGSFHYFVTLGLTMYGISESNAVTFAAIAHATQTFGLLIIWMLGFLMSFVKK